jgi:predicted MPP superfamily phosphohydrolase
VNIFDEQILGAVIFVSLVALVFVLATTAVIRLFRRSPARRMQMFVDRLSLLLAIFGLACIGWGYFVEPYRLTISRVAIRSPKILPGSSPVRIVHFSDLHSDPKARLEPELPAAVAAERPDIIVFTGDAINSPEGLSVFQKALTAVAKLAPTFVVKGNWDVAYWSDLKIFEGTGVQELNNTAERLVVRGTPIWIVGFAASNDRLSSPTVTSIPPGEFSLLLYHYPDILGEAATRHIDLYCAGHTHGGQVALPLYGALVTLSQFGKRYEAGLYRQTETWMYVNRGIGMEGGYAPRVRFWSAPELTVIDISP